MPGDNPEQVLEEALKRISYQMNMDISYRGKPLSQEDAQKIEEASSIITDNFAWVDTREGADFWLYVALRLSEIARQDKDKEWTHTTLFYKVLEFLKLYGKF